MNSRIKILSSVSRWLGNPRSSLIFRSISSSSGRSNSADNEDGGSSQNNNSSENQATNGNVAPKFNFGQKDYINNVLGNSNTAAPPKAPVAGFRRSFQFSDSMGDYNRAPNTSNGFLSQFNKFTNNDGPTRSTISGHGYASGDTGSGYNPSQRNISLGLGYSAGRSIAVIGDNPMPAYKTLAKIINNNNVRRTLYLKRRYEKPAVKRRRLLKEVNAYKVKREVKKKVITVLRMKGWGF